MAKVTLDENEPLQINVRYCDVVGGENGADIRFKGLTHPGKGDAVLYLRHDVCLEELARLGILGDVPPYDRAALPPRGVEIPLLHKQLTFVSRKGPGERRAHLEISLRGAASNSQPPRQDRAASAASARTDARDDDELPPHIALYLRAVREVEEYVAPHFNSRFVFNEHQHTAAVAAIFGHFSRGIN